jgi:hypothetical protein
MRTVESVPKQSEVCVQPAPVLGCELTALFVVLIAGLALRLAFYSGTVGDDDLRHAYAAYFLFAPASEKHGVIDWPDDTPYRRMAVNVPLWFCLRVCGTHEWALAITPLVFSLAGVVFMYVLLRVLAGPLAGVAAAAVWAFLPVQVYQATVWLQDDVFSGTLAGCICFLVLALRSPGRVRLVYAVLSGVALAYLQYAKETALLLLLPTVVALLLAGLRDRRAILTGAGVATGYVGLHLCAGLLFHQLNHGFFWYWGETLAFIHEKAAVERAPSAVLGLLWQRFFEKWLLGYAMVAFPILAGTVFLNRNGPYRILLALLLGVQLFVLYGATRMTTWQDRYTQQVSVPYVVISVLGVALLTDAVVQRKLHWLKFQRTIKAVLFAGLVIATAAALKPERQQFRYERSLSLKNGFAYWQAMSAAHEPVYTFERRKARASYTRRTLYQFAGFRAPPGSFRDWHEDETPSSGWAILSYLESRYGVDSVSIPSNWLLEYESGLPSLWTRVYRIVPPALTAGKVEALFSWPADDRARLVAHPASAASVDREQPGGGPFLVRKPTQNSPIWLRLLDTTQENAPLSGGIWIPPGVREVYLIVHIRTADVLHLEPGLMRVPVSTEGEPQPKQTLYFRPVAVAGPEGYVRLSTAACQTGEYLTPVLRAREPETFAFEVLDARLSGKFGF